MAVLLW